MEETKVLGGKKTGKKTCIVAVAFAAISNFGKTFFMLLKGTTDKRIFNAFLSIMIESFD